MARPERNNVDYFPFLCKEGKAMYYIEKTYGNDGYASWVRILRQLAVTNYHFLNLSDKVELMYLSSKCNISSETLISIINDLCDLDEFDKELWANNSIVFSQKFIDTIQDAYKKRNNKCITYEGLRTLLSSLGILKPNKLLPKVPLNTQSKVKYTKEEKTKEDIVARKLKFSSTLKPFLDTYGKNLLNDFYLYWTEENKSKTKFRQELERTWNLERRLQTWAKNDKNFNLKQNGKSNSSEKQQFRFSSSEAIETIVSGS